MTSRASLLTAVTRAIQGADHTTDLQEDVCSTVVDVGFAFACFSGRDGSYVTASQPDVDPPAEADVVPTFRGAAGTASQPDSETAPSTRPGVDPSSRPETDASGPTAPETPVDLPVTCISNEDGFTVTVPVEDGDTHYGTLAFGASERVDDDEQGYFATVGSIVGQGITRVTVVQERDRVRDVLARERRQFEKLHSVAAAMVGCEDAESIYGLAIDAAENILEFDICGIDVEEDGYLVPEATSTSMNPEDSQRIPTDEGIAGKTYRENETFIVDDVGAHPVATPSNPNYRSLLSVPIEEIGVFQAGSTERGVFSHADAELVELLMAHVSATLQRLQSAAALRESEEKYRTLIEQSHDAVAIYQDRGFAFVNQRATGLFDRERDALLGADACGLFHPEDRVKLERVVAELCGETGRQQTFEARIQRPNGDVRFCEFSATSITYDGDVAVLASIRDITDRKERERDLERQNERLEEFASVVSHDLRSPINVARGSVDLATDTGDLENLDRAAEALDRMEALVEDILQLARQGQLVDDTDCVSLPDVAADAWRSVDAPEATLDVATDASVEADRTRLRELFENLFRNAVEHAGSDVTVTLTSHQDGFAVVDDGPGIPPDSHEDVFERGFTSAEDGTGFGLAIVESIADAHDWTVEAVPRPDDESASRGAKFAVTDCQLH